MRPSRIIPFVFAVALLTACGDDPVAPVVFEVIEEAEFAASLDIDLAQMTKASAGGYSYYYQDLTVGEGPAATAGNAVVVTYQGWIRTGQLFDQGTITDLDGQPLVLGSGQVIPGFDAGIRGMQVGGVRKMVLPPELAYGAQGNSAIPAGSILIFQVTLDAIN